LKRPWVNRLTAAEKQAFNDRQRAMRAYRRDFLQCRDCGKPVTVDKNGKPLKACEYHLQMWLKHTRAYRERVKERKMRHEAVG